MLIERPFTPELFPRSCRRVAEAVSLGVAPGMVVGLWNQKVPGTFWSGAWGVQRLNPSDGVQPMSTGTVFDLASLSKVVATATLAAELVDRGWIEWETPLRAILPGFAWAEIKLGHLASHTAGLPAWEPLWERMRAHFSGKELWRIPVAARQKAMRDLVFQVAPLQGPGLGALYSDISFLLLGFALEEVCAMPLDQAVKTFLWNRWEGLRFHYRRVTHSVEKATDRGVAATENCPWRKGVLQGQVHDDNCWSMGGYAGHAGVFGAVRDLMEFGSSLLLGWSGAENYFSRARLQEMFLPVACPIGSSRTLGWDTPSGDAPAVGQFFSRKAVGHLGYTGTSLWIDYENGWVVTLLSNRVHPSRANDAIRAFRGRFHDALWQDLKN